MAVNLLTKCQASPIVLLLMQHILALVAPFLGHQVAAGPRNVTIDDQLGDELTQVVPTFLPGSGWKQGSECRGCVQLNASKAFKGTWHDTTRHPRDADPREIHFSFKGVSLYIFCIIANRPPGPKIDTLADYKFKLDGDQVGTYQHEPSNIPDFMYNTLVYTNETLDNRVHNFSFILDSSGPPVLLLYDYAIYTMIDDDPTNSPSPPPLTSSSSLPTMSSESTSTPKSQSKPTAIIIGGTLGGFFLFLLIITVLLLRRRSRGHSSPSWTPETRRPTRPYRHRRRRKALAVISPFHGRVSGNPIITAEKHRRPNTTQDGSLPEPESSTSGQLRQATNQLADEVNELRHALRDIQRYQQQIIHALEEPPLYIQ